MTPKVRIFRLLILVAFACTGIPASAQEPATPISSPAGANEIIEVKVMSFNVWLGGIQVDFGKVVEAIRLSGADVVGLQEVEGNAARIAEALGWQYVDIRNHVISRYPLIDPSGANGTYLYVQPRPGQVFAIANLHLPSSPYGPELLRDGATLEEVDSNERETRLAVAQRYLDALPTVIDAGIPVVVTGDFNTPSHLDWTAEAAQSRVQVTVPYEWPVGKAFEVIGLLDTYRQAHPDPAAVPGLTWTPGYPNPLIRDGETLDRIDWILASANVTTVDSQVVGEVGAPDVALGIHPWPSDHRAVVSTLQIALATPPVYVAVEHRKVSQGDPIVVRYQATGTKGERIGMVPADGSVETDLITTLPPQESFVSGSVMLGSALLDPGEYAAVLLSPDGGELARTTFWISAPAALPTVTVSQFMVAAGDPVIVNWADSPGFKWDWLSVYVVGEIDLYNYLGYVYTGAAVSGSIELDQTVFGSELPPGDYEVRLMMDDGYVCLASAWFTVKQSQP